MARLSAFRRRRLPASDFAIPERRPGPGSYPIPDRTHAQNALGRAEEHASPRDRARVRSAVHRKYPDMELGQGEHAAD